MRPNPGGWSAEVQALRALAVLLVVGYHLLPGKITGGYVGVDVFFVISGFLISGHILRDLEAGRFSLRDFYARRAQRLLPASMLVLFAVSLGVVAFVPSTRWVASAQQLLASAGYAQNWVLALSDVDYLDPAEPPTALQHFWSLSVEEQFYLVWPVLLLALTAALFRAGVGPGRRRAAVAGVMVAVGLVSFVHGVQLTFDEPTRAYFFSTTRVWEFAAGALLAQLLRPTGATTAPFAAGRGLLAWAGLAAIGFSGFAYTDRTPFPGCAALLPVAGALAFLGAGRSDWRWSPGVLVRLRPTQFVGDVSYSLYLWHWPLIVLLPAAMDQPRLTLDQKVLLLPCTLLLAWAGTTYVENRFRPVRDASAEVAHPGQPPVRRRPGRAVPVVLALSVGVAAVAGGAWWRVDDVVDDARTQAASALATGTPCFGAPALAEPGCRPPLGAQTVVPAPAGSLAELRNTQTRQDCFQSLRATALKTCTYGSPTAAHHVVLLGDSHALQWSFALLRLLDSRDWRLTTMLRASCSPSAATMYSPNPLEQSRCHRWATQALAAIEADPSVDVVITTALDNKTFVATGGEDGYTAGVRGYEQTWRRLSAGGARVVVLQDTPKPLPGTRAVDCVAKEVTARRCGRARDTATRPFGWRSGQINPMAAAVADLGDPRVRLVDLTDAFCTADRCPAVVGNVLVYADDNHMTPTYSATLAPALGRQLDALLGDSVTQPNP